MLETLDNLLENRFIEHQLLALHHGHHVATGQQFATLQYDAVGTGIKHVNPQLLVEYLAREDEHLHLLVHFLGLTANLHAHGGRSAQAEVEQYKVGLLLLDKPPEADLIVGSPDDLSLRNLVTYDTFSAFEFEGHVLDDNHLKLFHCIGVI